MRVTKENASCPLTSQDNVRRATSRELSPRPGRPKVRWTWATQTARLAYPVTALPVGTPHVPRKDGS